LQNFDVQLLEFFVVRTEPGDLIFSPTGECKRKKGNDGAPAAKTRERELLIGVRGEREVGRCAAGLKFHGHAPLGLGGKAASEE
jgi:hypothetical protein